MNILFNRLIRFSEPAIWSAALVALWFTYPAGDEGITLCIFHHIGITWCPGCGIGRSMAHLMNGNFAASLQAHWFGFPALIIIGYRIITLTLVRATNHGNHVSASQVLSRYSFIRIVKSDPLNQLTTGDQKTGRSFLSAVIRLFLDPFRFRISNPTHKNGDI